MLGLGTSLNNPRANQQFLSQYFGQLGNVIVLVLLIGAVTAFIEVVLINGPITFMAAERSLGRKATVGEAFRATRSRLLALAGGMFLFYVILAALGIGLSFTFFLCGLGIPLLVYVGMVLNAFLAPVLVLERVSIRQGLSRAWTLARARFWPVLGVTIFVYVIRVFFATGLQSAVALLTQGTVGLASLSSATVLTLVLQALIDVFLAPILPIAYTLLYEDSRIRLEGLDIALQNAASDAPQIADIASPPGEGIFNRSDMSNLVVFTLGAIALLVVIYGLFFIFARSVAGALIF
jgi:hypothetical protein